MSVWRVLLAALLGAGPLCAAELRTLQGETISGTIQSITATEVVIQHGDQRIARPIAQILQIDCNPAGKPPAGPFVDVELTDGSLLHCEKYAIKGKQIALTLLAGPQVSIPSGAVSNLLTDAHVEKDRKEWTARLTERRLKKKRRDMLAVRREGVLNALEGTLGDGDATGETIAFTTASGRSRSVAQNNLAGLIFEREVDANAAPVVCRITDTAGDLIQASSVVTSAGGFTITTPGAASFELKFAAVARLDYSGGKLVWLSEMEPSQVVERYVDDNPIHYRRDRNFDDLPLRLDGVVYPRGLALHATTELEYDLKGEFREFKAVAGIDDASANQVGLTGVALLRIEGDGKLLKELSFDRRNKIRQQEIVLNIKDVQKLRIRVAPGGDGLRLYFGLHLDIANAKVSK